jgi:hypothetical protein
LLRLLATSGWSGPRAVSSDPQGPLIRVQRVIVALGIVEHCQVVEVLGYIRMVGIEGRFSDPQGALDRGFSIVIVALGAVEYARLLRLMATVG